MIKKCIITVYEYKERCALVVKVTDVLAGSHGYKAGILAGDFLISVNSHPIHDVLDYRFYLAETRVELKMKRAESEYTVVINKRQYDDIGLEFDRPLMDKKHNCENKCIFCFIDQNPKGMRESIYFKDDDSRLSFLHGNYITLTNLHDEDIDRIIEMHISPVNISVHTTNPELRVKMMKNKRSGEVLKYIKRLSDAGIKLRGQIVLCKGINDGAELDRTMNDLYQYYPQLDSVSVVPAGLTRFRDGLYQLEPFTSDECSAVIKQVAEFGDMCKHHCGERVFFASDEFYVKSGMPLPEYDYWEEFTQIENGVGMLTSFEHEFELAASTLSDEEKKIHRNVSIATGEASYQMINKLASRLADMCSNVEVNVYPVKNDFFGGEVTVSGLMTGKDIADQLYGKNLGDTLYLPRTVLRSEGDLFLCGMTPEELSTHLGCEICFCENDGADFLYNLLGI